MEQWLLFLAEKREKCDMNLAQALLFFISVNKVYYYARILNLMYIPVSNIKMYI